MKKECTVLVCTNDINSDLWDPFFRLFEIYWRDNPFPIVLNTPSKKYEYNNMNISCFQLFDENTGGDVPFGKRMIECLKRIRTKYVLLLLDDHFLDHKVDTRGIEDIINWMDDNPSIVCFNFEASRDRYDINDEKYPGYVKRSFYGAFRYNLSPAVWRRDAFLESWKEHETPWEWESFGTMRSWVPNIDIYTRKKDFIAPIVFDPHNDAIRAGTWNMDVVEELFKKNGIEIDYSVRGTQYNPSRKYLDKKAIFKEVRFRRAIHATFFFFKYKLMKKIKIINEPYSFNKYSDFLNMKYYEG